MLQTKGKPERNLRILEAYAHGIKYEQISRMYGITSQRVQQIVQFTSYKMARKLKYPFKWNYSDRLANPPALRDLLKQYNAQD